MPVAAEIGSVIGDDHEMERSGRNHGVATGAGVVLAGGVGLNRRDCYPRIAHASKTTTITTVPMTRAMSSGDF
jgi:hypothetical protein